jgi:hypothetical protein
MFFLGIIIVFLVLFMRNGIVGFAAEKISRLRNRLDDGSDEDES